MIGVVNRTKIFEFRDMGELAQALSHYGKHYGNCDVIIIANKSDKVKSIIYNSNFELEPDGLNENEVYYVYGTDDISLKDLGKNAELPFRRLWLLEKKPFAYCTQRYPKELDIYNN